MLWTAADVNVDVDIDVDDDDNETRLWGQFKRQTLTFRLNALNQHFEVRLNESLDKQQIAWPGSARLGPAWPIPN